MEPLREPLQPLSVESVGDMDGAPIQSQDTPPVDNAHVLPGAEEFDEATMPANAPVTKPGVAKVFNAQKVLVNVYRESENDDYKDRANRLALKVKGTIEFE